MAAKTNLTPLSGPQALVEYVMLHNTDGRDAFYELERRVDVDGVQAVYLRYGAMDGARRPMGGARSVAARGTALACTEFVRDRVSAKERRGYRIVDTDLRATSLHDGTELLAFEALLDRRAAAKRKALNERVQAEVSAELKAPDKLAALADWVKTSMFS